MNNKLAQAKKGKAPAKRNSEARREQNRIASRNYREKRKQKLALLNQILEPSVSELVNVVNAAGQGSSDDAALPQMASSATVVDPIASIDTSTVGQDAFTESLFPNDTWGDLTASAIPASNAPFAQPFPNSLPFPFNPVDDPFAPMGVNLWATNSFRPQPLVQFSEDYVNTGIVQEISEDSPESTDQGEQPESLASTTQDDKALKNILNGVETLTLSQKRSLLRHLQQETQDTPSKSPLRMWPPTRAQMESLNKFTKALYNAANAGPTPLPAQYIVEAGLFGAIYANCYALGMGGIEEILCEEGCSIFSVTADEGHAPSQLPLVRPRFRNVTPDLRPTDLQLTFGHHPYVDVIPFKSFRDNIIKALLHDPPLIDEGILCHDLLAGGFTCWGSRRNPLGMNAGVPWDARSWEPSIWFLIKYRQLTGGWDDEMWKSARWWHSVRGERIQTAQAMSMMDNGACRGDLRW
ncbi:hypothetical protein NW754_006503 [Fusarium falciforme]|uniref:BZIP domain-containing protein n=1 Tax=Fusarium falciforme TaxID=195108 RepID=A0A9W8V8A0_9HYPO|nr:hypothetical protein NW754_006503 [Fusarium falciforme]KAJ4197822.1 hypothetical protein NW755_000520 [Fusarium falciforme]